MHQLTHNMTTDCSLTVHKNCKLRIPAEHVMYTHCYFCFVDIQNNFGTQQVLLMLRLRASEKDVPVPLKSFLNRDFFYFS